MSIVTTHPELSIDSIIHNMRPTLSPFLAHLSLFNCNQWPFPSTNSTLHMTGLTLISICNGVLFIPKQMLSRGTSMNLGQYLFIQSSIDLSRQLIDFWLWHHAIKMRHLQIEKWVYLKTIFWNLLHLQSSTWRIKLSESSWNLPFFDISGHTSVKNLMRMPVSDSLSSSMPTITSQENWLQFPELVKLPTALEQVFETFHVATCLTASGWRWHSLLWAHY